MKGVTPDVLSRANSVRKGKGRKKGELAAQDLAFAFTFLFSCLFVFSSPPPPSSSSWHLSSFRSSFPSFFFFFPLLFFFWVGCRFA